MAEELANEKKTEQSNYAIVGVHAESDSAALVTYDWSGKGYAAVSGLINGLLKEEARKYDADLGQVATHRVVRVSSSDAVILLGAARAGEAIDLAVHEKAMREIVAAASPKLKEARYTGGYQIYDDRSEELREK